MAAPGSDRISLLPNNILEDILVRLPLQEVVTTSVLSKRWKYLWTKLPNLIFDSSFCKESVSNDKDRLKLIIENILLRSHKPILQFTLSLDGLSSFHIDQLVTCACDNGVKYLELEIPNGELYELRSLDQLCLLKRLTLDSCQVKVPLEFKCFNMLTYMNFFNVEIDGYELSRIISSCPLLEILTLENLQMCRNLYLNAPRLRVFQSIGYFFNLWLDYTPQLEKMTAKIYDIDYDVEENSDGEEDSVVPFGVIPALKAMTLDGPFLKYMNAQQKISRCRDVLNNLKKITLTDVAFELTEESQNVLCLIQRSPNLEKLVVTTCTENSASDPGVGVWQSENLPDVSLNRLRQVIVLNITGKQSELRFIETLLAKSPMLETMVVNLIYRINAEDGLRISEEIRRYGRASSQVNICAMDPEMKFNFQRKLFNS